MQVGVEKMFFDVERLFDGGVGCKVRWGGEVVQMKDLVVGDYIGVYGCDGEFY